MLSGGAGSSGSWDGTGMLSLSAELRQTLLAHARAGLPDEACGLLLGGGNRVADVLWLANRAATPRTHYALDPLEYMRAEQHADRQELAVIGVWHSHPEAAAEPSATDARDAWPGWFYLIVGRPGDAVPEVRAWRLTAGRFTEVRTTG